MKRQVLLSTLGLAVSSTLVRGQGSIAFDTYDADHENGILITYGAGGSGPPIGTPLDNTFTGVLLWSATPISDAATTIGSLGDPLDPLLIVGSVGSFATPSTIADGYIVAPNLNISASVGQTLYFEVAAYNGSSWSTSTWSGHSASFTATLVTGTTLPNPDQLDNLQPFQVFGPIPEPATLALGGLGLAALFLSRRKPA